MIEWSVDPEIIQIGPFSLRWYGLLFASSFFVGFQIMDYIFKREKKSDAALNALVWYMVLGTIIGARLGHCLFYNPEYYLKKPLEILMVWHGGLASHGAAIGIFIALYLFVKKYSDFTYLWIIDKIVIVVALSGFFIRMGNLFNSEIIGTETDLPWSFVFVAIDNVPRHPAQLYEALFYLFVFILLFILYKKYFEKIPQGTFLGIFLILVFGFRFFVEFIKEDQSEFERNWILNMGQILSIPMVLLGAYLLFKVKSQLVSVFKKG